ncbi:MAG: helix-turn-helix transcriptional regulator [Bacteroidales bacterium]
MKDRILVFLRSENKSYAQFAEEIGVQPSGISHILSGRNNPSLDFVIKMLHRYSNLSADWLLFGRGPMYRFVSQPTLFDVEAPGSGSEEVRNENASTGWSDVSDAPDSLEVASEATTGPGEQLEDPAKRVVRVLFFYSDKTFTEYRPC